MTKSITEEAEITICPLTAVSGSSVQVKTRLEFIDRNESGPGYLLDIHFLTSITCKGKAENATNTFSHPSRHIRMLGQDPLMSHFNALGTPLVKFFNVQASQIDFFFG